MKKFPVVSSKVSWAVQKFPVWHVQFPAKKPGNFLQIVALGKGLQGFLLSQLETRQETQSFLMVSLGGFLSREVS